MPNRETADQVCDRLETLHGRVLSEEERGELDLWNKGRALHQLVNFYGFEVLREMITSYGTSAMEQLLRVPPGDERVVAVHAAAYGINDMVTKLFQDIDAAIQASATTPAVLKHGLQKISSEAPLESL